MTTDLTKRDEFFGALDLESVSVSYDTIETGVAKSVETDLARRWRSRVFYGLYGRMEGQFVPFIGAYDEETDPTTGEMRVVPEWDWCCVQHTHQSRNENGWPEHFLWSVDQQLVKDIGKDMPGWQLPCMTHHGAPTCPPCEAKWDVGKWYKDNTSDGWSDPAFKALGLMSDRTTLAYFHITRHPGEWLQSEDGQVWIESQRRALRSTPNKARDKFDAGVKKAIDDYELWVQNPQQVELFELGWSLYNTLTGVDLFGNPRGGELIRPTKSAVFSMVRTLDPKSSIAKTQVNIVGYRPLVVKRAKGREVPDIDAIRTMLQERANLREYAVWPDGVAEAVETKISRIYASIGLGKAIAPTTPKLAKDTVARAGSYLERDTQPKALTYEEIDDDNDDIEDAEILDDEDAPDATMATEQGPSTQVDSNGVPVCFRLRHTEGHPVCAACSYELECVTDDADIPF